jgi:hypothetical protein
MRTLVRIMAALAVWWAGYSTAEIARMLWLYRHGALLDGSDWRPEVAGCVTGTALAALVWCTLREWATVPAKRRLRPPGGPRSAPERQPRRLRPHAPALARDIALLHPVGSAGDGR